MERKRDGLLPIGEVFGSLDGPVQAIRDASPQARHHFTRFDQVRQLVWASEAVPDLGFMARLRVREDDREYEREERSERVEWSETRNVTAEDPRQASRVMAATAARSEELKQLAGVKAGGRALEKPVCHYSLSWATDESPSREAMMRAAAASMEALGLADRQAVMVAHRDTAQPHVHVVVNWVSVEDGRAAILGRNNSRL